MNELEFNSEQEPSLLNEYTLKTIWDPSIIAIEQIKPNFTFIKWVNLSPTSCGQTQIRTQVGLSLCKSYFLQQSIFLS